MYEKVTAVAGLAEVRVSEEFFAATSGSVVTAVYSKLWTQARQGVGFNFTDLHLIRVLHVL